MQILKALWSLFKRAGFAIGEVISRIVLTIFYFTIFALFAFLYKIFAKNPLAVQSESSNWVTKKKNIQNLEDLRFE
jgi:short subunit fatty acids transporter